MLKPVSDETLLKFMSIFQSPEILNDRETFELSETVLCDMLMNRRKAKITANLERITR